ncbi:MAG: sigma-54 dependent transcriptional regulator [Thermoguttaceae bacterium]|jgi:DNA-binding NtrC family response regulator
MPRKVLVIANDSAIGLSYQRTLCSDGYDVQFYGDPAAGIEAAIVGDFDVVLLRIGETTSGGLSQFGHQASLGRDENGSLEILRRIREANAAARVVVLSDSATVEMAVAAMREGAADYLREPCPPEDLRSALRRIEPPLSGPAEPDPPPAATGCPQGFEGMLGQCAAMGEVFDLIKRIAPADSTVLVAGESGTGKEMVVRAIHRLSRRGDYPLLACDCTALAPTLLESELFGHVKGSFSGAIATKKGLFEVAHQGTLFLDEVANLSLETQGKLLRVLESRHVRKVGDTAEHEVDIRLIATTNRSLAELVKTGAFRADLYYRLNVVPITLPPLRLRSGDVPLLATAFLRHFSRQMAVEVQGFTRDAMRQMEMYAWPGNVRELRNIIERLTVLYGGSRIEWDYLPWEVREAAPTVSATEVPGTWEELKSLKRQIVEDLERRFLTAALQRASQNITQAAESVGMQRPNFHALMRHHGLKPDRRPEK